MNAPANPPRAGYSGTPLAKKLGILEGTQVLERQVPERYREWLEPLPQGVQFVTRLSPSVDVIHLFVTRRATLQRELEQLRDAIRPDAALWVSWPKQSAKAETDLSDQTIRDLALPLGFVDVKVCAVSEVWSGLKLVVRKALRAPAPKGRRVAAKAKHK